MVVSDYLCNFAKEINAYPPLSEYIRLNGFVSLDAWWLFRGISVFFIVMEQEIWKPVAGYEGLYEVSNMGNIRSVTRTVLQQNKNGVPIAYNTLKGKPIKLSKDRYGYLYCTLSKNGNKTPHMAHRMVAEAFLESGDPSKYCIDHINTVRTDNRASNLRYVSIRENNNNPLTLKNLKKALNSGDVQKRRIETLRINGCQKPPRYVYMYDLKGNFIRRFPTMSDAAKFVNTNNGSIHYALYKQKDHIHKGYKWYDKRIEPTQ